MTRTIKAVILMIIILLTGIRFANADLGFSYLNGEDVRMKFYKDKRVGVCYSVIDSIGMDSTYSISAVECTPAVEKLLSSTFDLNIRYRKDKRSGFCYGKSTEINVYDGRERFSHSIVPCEKVLRYLR